MLKLAEESAQNFRKGFLGKKTAILFEQQGKGVWSGYTDTYIKGYVKSDLNLVNELLEVQFQELHEDGVLGKILQ